MSAFLNRLTDAQYCFSSTLCVGLDPVVKLLPESLLRTRSVEDALVTFCLDVAEATAPYACAFKVNVAFFEVHGVMGWRALHRVLSGLPATHIRIADAKRGDIGNTAQYYAEAFYKQMGADACTVAPYMGADAVRPFLQYPGKAAFVLGRTSNASAVDFQNLRPDGGDPLYMHVARKVAEWNADAPGQAGLVVGATAPEELKQIREACPTLPFLVPGVGAQGGSAETVMQQAATANGQVLVNSSRQILYAKRDGVYHARDQHYAEAAAEQAKALQATLVP
ncbi:MAG: orotidine-5'-phosphate decarboxylase [Rhodothermales bacterium]